MHIHETVRNRNPCYSIPIQAEYSADLGIVSLLMLRSIYSQGHGLQRTAQDILFPQETTSEALNHASRLGQNQD